MFNRPTIQEVRETLTPLIGIPRPDRDNEGDPINGDTVFPYLSPMNQELVRRAEEIVYEYARTTDGQVDRRAVNTMTKNGFRASFDPSQYDQDRLVGYVTVGDWKIDISDPRSEMEDEED